uniref:tyrosine-type recombinase/integrase n=1 Tax=Frankia sp. Cr1 TaxID=3073931 RepID=UPI002AD40EEC
LPKWGDWPISSIEHQEAQQWVTNLGKRLSRATVAECLRLLSAVMKSAVHSRLIAFNPCEEVRVPRRRKTATSDITITREELVTKLLPVVPGRYRPLVATAGLGGLRWGECVGLRWGRVDLDGAELHIVETLVEVSGKITPKPFPKSKAGRRTVPIPAGLVGMLRDRKAAGGTAGRADLVFTNTAGGPVGRTSFRSRIWRPALVKAGMLGTVIELGPHKFKAVWADSTGTEWSKEFTTERDAIAHVARKASGGLRFHDLRHSYATWLISSGVPVNVVQGVLGHEQASTTLNRYTHKPKDYDNQLRAALSGSADFSLTSEPEPDPENEEDPPPAGS